MSKLEDHKDSYGLYKELMQNKIDSLKPMTFVEYLKEDMFWVCMTIMFVVGVTVGSCIK